MALTKTVLITPGIAENMFHSLQFHFQNFKVVVWNINFLFDLYVVRLMLSLSETACKIVNAFCVTCVVLFCIISELLNVDKNNSMRDGKKVCEK